jgi:hypothetical protein
MNDVIRITQSISQIIAVTIPHAWHNQVIQIYIEYICGSPSAAPSFLDPFSLVAVLPVSTRVKRAPRWSQN